MDIAIRKFQRNHIIDVNGDLDLYNAFHLNEAVLTIVTAQKTRSAMIDGAAVPSLRKTNIITLKRSRKT